MERKNRLARKLLPKAALSIGVALSWLVRPLPANAVGEITTQNEPHPTNVMRLDNVPRGSMSWSWSGLSRPNPWGRFLSNGNRIYVCASTRRAALGALSMRGKNVWIHVISSHSEIWPPVMAADGTLFLATGTWMESMTRTGHVKWRLRLPKKISTPPSVSLSGTLYVGVRDHCLHAISATGFRRWKYCTKALPSTRPIVGPGGVIYFGTHNGTLYAVRQDGTLKWKVHLIDTALLHSPVLMPDGTLYMLTSSIVLKKIPPSLLKVIRHRSAMHGTFSILIKVTASGRIQWGLVGPTAGRSAPFTDLSGKILVSTAQGGIIAASPSGTWSARAQLGPTFAHAWMSRGRSGTILVVAGHDVLVLNAGLRPIWRARISDAGKGPADMLFDGSVLVEGRHRLMRVLPPL